MDFAYDSISAFSDRRDNQEAVFGAEEGLKDIKYVYSSPYANSPCVPLCVCVCVCFG